MSKQSNWDVIRTESYQETFAGVGAWLRTASAPRRPSFMARRRAAYALGTVMLLFAACNLPVTQTETLGNAITFTVPADRADTEALVSQLSWIDPSKLTAEETEGRVRYRYVTDVADDDMLNQWVSDLRGIGEVQSARVFPLESRTRRPAYAAALHSFFRIQVNTAGLTDAEITNMINAQLAALGAENVEAQFSGNADGSQQISISAPGDGSESGNASIDMSIDRMGAGSDAMGAVLNFDMAQIAGKTDAEIKALVEEKLRAQGITGFEVVVEEGAVRLHATPAK